MIEARDHAGTTTIPTLHGDKIAIKREGLSSGSGGGASGSDPNQSSLSWEKAITHHKLETLTTAVRVFKVCPTITLNEMEKKEKKEKES